MERNVRMMEKIALKINHFLILSSNLILFACFQLPLFFLVTYITVALHQRALYDSIKDALDYFVKRKNKYRGLFLRANRGKLFDKFITIVIDIVQQAKRFK